MDKPIRPMTRGERELFGLVFEEPQQPPFLVELARMALATFIMLALVAAIGGLFWMATADIVKQIGS